VIKLLYFTSLTGAFATLDLPALAGGLTWNTSQLYSNGVLSVGGVPGDYNQNGIVDAADYVVWRKTDGSPQGYDTWRSHFGQTAGSGSGISANAAVPEPATVAMLIFATFGWCLRRRRAA
jgi:PEP-CTERM motif